MRLKDPSKAVKCSIIIVHANPVSTADVALLANPGTVLIIVSSMQQEERRLPAKDNRGVLHLHLETPTFAITESDWKHVLQRLTKVGEQETLLRSPELSAIGKFFVGSVARDSDGKHPRGDWHDWHFGEVRVPMSALRSAVGELIREYDANNEKVRRVAHDEISPSLQLAMMKVVDVRKSLEDGNLRAAVAAIQPLLQTAAYRLRDLESLLVPASEQRLYFGSDLKRELNLLVAEVNDSVPGKVRITIDPAFDSRMEPEVAVGLYKIAREGTSRAVQVPDCAEVVLVLGVLKGRLALEIRNNCRPSEASSDVCSTPALLRIEHFASEIGMQVAVTCDSQNGTNITVASTKKSYC